MSNPVLRINSVDATNPGSINRRGMSSEVLHTNSVDATNPGSPAKGSWP